MDIPATLDIWKKNERTVEDTISDINTGLDAIEWLTQELIDPYSIADKNAIDAARIATMEKIRELAKTFENTTRYYWERYNPANFSANYAKGE